MKPKKLYFCHYFKSNLIVQKSVLVQKVDHLVHITQVIALLATYLSELHGRP